MKNALVWLKAFLFLMLASTAICYGQQNDLQETGLVQYGSYHGGDIDSIDLKSGNLFAKIPLFSLPQLGDLSLSMSMEINNSGYAMDSFCEWVVIDDASDMEDACYPYVYRTTMFGPSLTLDQSFGIAIGGGAFGDYNGNCCDAYYTSFSMVDATGASHTMAQDVYNTNIARAIDGSGFSFIGATANNTGTGTLVTPTGLQVAVDNFTDQVGITNGNQVSSIRDIHGDSIFVGLPGDSSTLPQAFRAQVLSCCGQQISDPGMGENQAQLPLPFTATITDSLGRVIPDFYNATFASDPSSLSVCPNLGISNQQPALVQTWTVPGPYDPNLPLGQQYQSSYKFCYTNITVNTNLLGGWQLGLSDDGSDTPDASYYADMAESAYVIQSIILPNGTHWGFVYDSGGPISEYINDPLGQPNWADGIPPGHYGDVTQIIYPTGGSVSYTYYNSLTNPRTTVQALISCGDPSPWFGRAVASRTLSLSNTDPNPRTWTYNLTAPYGLVPSSNGPFAMVATVIDPTPSQGENRTQTVHTFQHPPSWPASINESQACLLPEIEIDYDEIQASSHATTTLRKVINNYNYTPVYLNGPTGIYAQGPVYATSLQSATVEEGFGSVTTSYTYPNLFTTAQYFYWASTGSMAQASQTEATVPFSQPSTVIVTGSDGSSKMTSNTYQWQNSTPFYNANVLSSLANSCTSPVNVNAGACTLALSGSGAGTQYTYGDSGSPYDVASVQQILNGNWVTTKSMTSDSHGRVTSTRDAYGNQTSILAFETDPVTGGATPFPAQIQRPLMPMEYYSYDDNSGNLLSYKDVNANTTTYQYGDPEGRLTSVSYPDGGSTTYCYTDVGGSSCSQSSPPYSLVTTTVGAPDPNIVTTTVYDGLGRVSQNQINSNPVGTVYTDTSYDALGRAACVSNPHYSGSSNGQTCTIYDGLSRKVVQTLPDNSTMQWCYDGLQTDGQANCQASSLSSIASVSWVDATDGVGHHSQQSSDGLGNLISVMEQAPAGTSLSLETDYGYDVLGNLLVVNQLGNVAAGDTARTRSFTYDQMSRLITSTNPETGTICYGQWSGGSPSSGACQGGYDLDSNLQYKTDARGVTISYSYDQLNRLTGKTYSGETSAAASIASATPPSTYVYGTANTNGLANVIGRLISEYTGTSTAPSTQHAVTIYDKVGRVQNETQCITASGCSGAPYAFQYMYDLAGSTVYSNNGVSNMGIGLTSQYDGTGQLQTLTSTWDDATHPLTLFAPIPGVAQYSPGGGLLNAVLGVNQSGSQYLVNMQRSYDNRLRVLSETDTSGFSMSIPASGSTGTISVSGTEGNTSGAGTPGTATITISGSEGTHTTCTTVRSGRTTCVTTYDTGVLVVTINGFTAYAYYGQGSNDSSVATAMAAALSASGSPVTAIASANVVSITSIATGPNSNYALSITNGSDFSGTDSGMTLTGGTSGASVYDSGAVTVTVNGTTAQVTFGASDTSQSIAGNLATAINSSAGRFLTASPSGSTVNLVSNQTGLSENWTLSASVTDTSGQFSPPSFSVQANGMSGGANASTGPAVLYSYSIPSTNGYAANGNLLSVNDLVMANWNYSYDNLNRLKTAQSSPGSSGVAPYGTGVVNWTYDSFGNYQGHTLSGSSPTSISQIGYTYTGSSLLNGVQQNGAFFNRIDNYNYDAAGNLLYDNLGDSYIYDAEGRLSTINGTTQYLYDAEGRRAAKLSSGTLINQYLFGLAGQQVSELDGQGNWVHSNVFANGSLLATYKGSDTYFSLNDWFGTKRVEMTPDGCVTSFGSLPFGDGLAPSGNCVDATEQHYTGKERDSESGLDYFGARYYGSNMGRFISPDPWLGSMNLEDPQSLNRYAYVLNNPLKYIDPNGLDCAYMDDTGTSVEEVDHDTTQGECAENGGYYAPGHFSASDVHSYSYTDLVTIQSYQQGSGWINTTSNCQECNTRNADGSLMGASYISNGANLSLSFNITMGSGMTALDDPSLNPLGRAIIGSVAKQTASVVKGLNCFAAGAAPFAPVPLPLDAGNISSTAGAGASDYVKDKAKEQIKETLEKGGTEFAERGAAAMSIVKYGQATYEGYNAMKEAGCLGDHK